MKAYMREALISAALFGGISMAAAQDPAPNADRDHAAQPSSRPDMGGKQEPGAKGAPPSLAAPKDAPAPGDNALLGGRLNVPGAPADTDTAPAKFSAKNDGLDKLPIMARGPQLTDEQKKLILDTVMVDRQPSANDVAAAPATELPDTVEMQEWPSEVVGQVPAVKDTKYVKLSDRILLVLPQNRIVVSEIRK